MLDCLLLSKVFDGAAMVFSIIDGAVLLAFKWTHNKILNVWTIDQTDMLRFEECLCLDEWMIWLVLWVWGSRLAVLRITLSTSPGYRQFYEFLQVDWATFLTYSLKMECTYFLKARELPC